MRNIEHGDAYRRVLVKSISGPLRAAKYASLMAAALEFDTLIAATGYLLESLPIRIRDRRHR
jgi:hypothetical protein